MSESKDFFVSYTSKDRRWAEWIAWTLEEGGYTTTVQAWDFIPGTDWVHAMREGLRHCDRVVAVLSPDYLVSKFAAAEWEEAFRRDPLGEARALIPVRIVECEPGELLNQRVYCDLVSCDEETARVRLLQSLSASRVKPTSRPPFPDRPAAQFPGPATLAVELPVSESNDGSLAGQPVLSHVLRKLARSRSPDLLLHTFCGLSAAPISEAPPSFTSIYHLWADAEGSSISASLSPAAPSSNGPRHFVIRFHNAPRTFSSNVAFRPGGTSGLANRPVEPAPNHAGRRYLSFEARRPDPDKGGLGVIALAYRIIDRLGTHWTLQGGISVDRISTAEWSTFTIDLHDRGWSVFTSDGNHLYACSSPDFSLLVAVVIDFGSDEGIAEPPGDGQGVVHLRNFRLQDGVPGGAR